MDNEMIERVAIALKEAQWGKQTKWEDCDESFKIIKRLQALAAIKSMHEPTEKMLDAGCDIGPDRSPSEYWYAMIDAITND